MSKMVYDNEYNVLARLGVDVSDMDNAYKNYYYSFADDFSISMEQIDTDKKTYGLLRVWYDEFYSNEYYIPVTSEEETRLKDTAEQTVISLLKSPKIADFPSITSGEWIFVKSPYYLGVSAYVDAENSFGAEIRNDFVFIYDSVTGRNIYAKFGGQVIADNGYVSYKDLIKAKLAE